MKSLFVGVIVLSVVALSVVFTHFSEDETSDVELVLSDVPLHNVVTAAGFQ